MNRSGLLSQSKRRLGRMIESLESRRLLAAIINGTNGDDAFIVSVDGNNNINVIFNGQPQTIGAPGDNFAEVNGLGGNDSITLLNTGSLFWDLSGGAGDDHHVVGSGNLVTDINRRVNVFTNGDPTGINTIVVNNTSGGNLIYDIDGPLLTYFAIGSTTIQLGNEAPGDRITVQSGNGNDLLRVTDLPENALINMGGGNDTVDLAGTDNILATNLPTSTRIEGGASGTDELIVDDSNPASTRTSITFDDTGLVGGPALDDFNRMTVQTHLVTDGAEPVTFRGNFSLAPFVTVIGSSGADLVQVGEPGNEAFLPLYAERFFFDLGGGFNDVGMYDQPTVASRSWLIDDAGFHAGGGGILDIASAGILNLNFNGANGNDVFTIQAMPGWNITLNGGGGNDSLVMGTIKDLDNVFDQGRISFNGGGGTDTVDLDDSGDQTGIFDDYLVAETLIVSKNGTTGNTESFVEYFDAENLSLRLNNDPNVSDLDLSDFDTALISGNGGADEFRIRNTGSSLPNQLVPNLADSTTFLGGAGDDTLSLDDSDTNLFSSTPEYTLDVAAFQWRVNTTVRTVAFDSIARLELTTGDNSDSILINRRPAVTALNVESGIGDDTFSIGGGDLDSNGFFAAGATLNAGTGNDNITFDDRNDRDAAGETETYTFGNLSIAKGAQTLLYSTFESQTLLAADGVISGQLNTIPVVNLNFISGFLNSTTINGGPNRGCFVNVGDSLNNLSGISGVVNVNTAARLTVNDAGQTFGSTSSFEINNSQVRKTSNNQTINYSAVGQITLNARNSTTVSDSINVRSVPAGTAVIVNANAGNDNISLGFGNTGTNLLGTVTINAGAGTDNLSINNSLDTAPGNMTLDVFSFTDGQTHSINSIEGTMTLALGNGDTNLTINGTATNTNVTGGTGNDTYTVGGGDIDGKLTATVAEGLFISDNGGTNTLRLDDLNDTNLDDYIFQQGSGLDQFLKRDGTSEYFVTWLGMSSVTLDASNAATTDFTNSRIIVNNINTPLRINGNAGSDSIFVEDAAAPVTVSSGLGDLDSLIVNADFAPGDVLSTVVIEQSDDFEGFEIFEGGTVRVASGATLLKTRNRPVLPGFLTLNGVLDLAGGAFISRAGGSVSLDGFRSRLVAGRNGGAWSGSGFQVINSSRAASSSQSDGVGYGLGSEVAVSSIGGFNIAAGDILVRYTLDGDADLNGVANISDFARLAANFNGMNKVWATGDSNYDNAANISDFASLAANFNQTAPRQPSARTARSLFSTSRIDSKFFDDAEAADVESM